MSIYTKIKRKLMPTKKTKYSNDMKVKGLPKGNLFNIALNNNKKALKLKVVNKKNGVSVRVTFDYTQNDIVYHFKYNRDRLLLLKGVSNNEGMILAENSIPDFAISASPHNVDCHMQWVPVHGRVDNVSVNTKIDILYDDKKFEIIQTFDAVNPHAPNEKMWSHYLTHTISTTNPFLEIRNKIEVLQDINIGSMYLTMLPANSKKVNKLYLDNGTEFNMIPNDGTEIKLDEGIKSAMYTGKSKHGDSYCIAVESLCETAKQSIITFRDDDVSKFYINHFNGLAKSGVIFKNAQKIVCVNIDDSKLI